MWRLVLIMVFCTACMGFDSMAREVTEQKTFDKTIPFRPGGLVTVQNENGDIGVQSWGRNEVRILAYIKVRAHDYEEAEELLDRVEIRIKESNGRLDIYTERPRQFWYGNHGVSVHYELTVPDEIDLDLKTVNGGGAVETITGEVRIKTTNGGIKANRVRGSVQAETTNGDIEVELVAHDGSDDLRFSTTNGSIHVALPEDIRGALEARTTNGHIETDFPITVQGKFSQKSISGDLNGGGPIQIELKTTNGSIHRRKAF